jgi:hypothetical protein
MIQQGSDYLEYHLERETTSRFLTYGIMICLTFLLPWAITPSKTLFFWDFFDEMRGDSSSAFKALTIVTILGGIALIVISRIQMSARVRGLIGLAGGLLALILFTVFMSDAVKESGAPVNLIDPGLLIGVIALAFGCRLRMTCRGSLVATIAISLGAVIVLLMYLIPMDQFRYLGSGGSTNRISFFFEMIDKAQGDFEALIIGMAIYYLALLPISLTGLLGLTGGRVEGWMRFVASFAVFFFPILLMMVGIIFMAEEKYLLIFFWVALHLIVALEIIVTGGLCLVPRKSGAQPASSGGFDSSVPTTGPVGYGAPQQPGPAAWAQPQQAAGWTQPQQAAPQTPACAHCHQSTRWIPEYSRYYCDSCQHYV